MAIDIRKKLLKVRPFQETLHGGYCGPASLKIVLDYYGVQRNEREIAERCGRDKNLGINDMAIKRAARFYGLDVEIKNKASFADIQRWLNKGVPVIVNWFTRGRSDYNDSEVSDGHYSVVMGLDSKNIYLQDPEIGAMRTIRKNDFLRVWFDFTGRYIRPDQLIIRQIIAIHKK